MNDSLYDEKTPFEKGLLQNKTKQVQIKKSE